MSDLADPKLLYLKGFLFLGGGGIAGALLLLDAPTWKAAFLLAATIWCFCRFYYFAFYVIEHYVDGEFRFAGLFSFLKYLLKRRDSSTPPSHRDPAKGG